jgi:hypothetical protein|uniref:Uncharacterized protein n=1 Tax=viral metagenome TaxID=1070528 RepID=A0A6C0B9J0_9ZZZZ
MAYFDAIVEIPFAPPGVNAYMVCDWLEDELNNGIYQVTEETVRTRRGKHKKITVNASCRIHTYMFKEADKTGRVIRYLPYKGKTIRVRMWVSRHV